jgi:hypothetical protein
LLFYKNETFLAMNTSDPKKPAGSRFPVHKIPPSHDYIRQHGSRQPPAAPVPPRPLYGDVHKFGYTRPLKKHEEATLAAPGPDPGGDAARGAEPPGAEPPGAEPPPTPSPPFVHLHVHSNFSFLDGGSRIEELVARAAELGQPALALTDHDGLYEPV